ncbi:hypothetical protein [Xenorhabdus sp. KK7.4]|uniref:hypothetical protein n=1 Tax=Xenorhabdus sp. KK7.4 TaxID=1851572 RepID=UPI000C038D57|nr:hypothetical protein [Xenorhabdus sp. KK7.4]PHM59102.1 hypothetical protein Xekk_00942 [Xenorhabdus sp. KK7.4]
MRLSKEKIVITDDNGITRLSIGVNSSERAATQIPKTSIIQELFIELEHSHQNEPIIAIWDSLTLEQKNVIKQVIANYQDEIFSLECQIAESDWYASDD